MPGIAGLRCWLQMSFWTLRGRRLRHDDRDNRQYDLRPDCRLEMIRRRLKKGVPGTVNNNRTADEAAIRDLVENWAKAVRTKNLNGILAYHSPEILMFDVPPPIQSKGIEAYKQTWDLFFSWSQDSGVFDITDMNITAGNDVAFVTALMRCAGAEESGERNELDFRLTIGLRKIVGQWIVMHEHHSIPAS